MHTSAYLCNVYARSYCGVVNAATSPCVACTRKRAAVRIEAQLAKLGSLEGLRFLAANSIQTSACQLRSPRLVPRRFYLTENYWRVSSICIVTVVIHTPGFRSRNLVSSPVAGFLACASTRQLQRDQVHRSLPSVFWEYFILFNFGNCFSR